MIIAWWMVQLPRFKSGTQQVSKTLAIESRRTPPSIAVIALHPGATYTFLSRPSQRNVPREQLFSPAKTLGCMLNIPDAVKPEQSGQFLAFDGERLPW
jgi:hypothetical protein